MSRRPPASALRIVILAPVVAAAVACGSESTSPTAPAAPAPPEPVLVSVTAGDDGRPVAGATVVVGGQSYLSDAQGLARLPSQPAATTPVDVLAAGYLDRQTLVRSRDPLRFSLWPQTNATGLDAAFTERFVYTHAGREEAVPGARPLIRLREGTRLVAIIPSAEIVGDSRARAAHGAAVEKMTRATGGQVSYEMLAAPPGGGVTYFDAEIDPSDDYCRDLYLAVTRWRVTSNVVEGGRIVYCSLDVARKSTVTHEIGHTFGFGHSPNRNEVMGTPFSRGRASDFSPREALTARLMLQRSAGNRFPDSDRTLRATASGTLTIACR